MSTLTVIHIVKMDIAVFTSYPAAGHKVRSITHEPPGYADDGDADERHDDTDDDRRGEVMGMACEDGAEDGAQGGTGAQREALAQGHAEVTHAQAEGQAADAPQGAEKDGQQRSLGMGCVHGKKGFSRRHGEQRTEQRENEPGEDTLDNPVAFPAPRLDLIDRHIAAALAERADGDD